MSIRDTLIYDAKQLANETITNFGFYLGLNLAGVHQMVFSPNDGVLVSSVKSALISSGASVAGAAARTAYPPLAFFS